MYFNTYNEKIIYVGKNDPYSLFSCMLAGVTYKNPNYRIVRNNCDVYVFEYVVSGKGSIEVGDRVYDVHEGMFYCLEKGVDEVHYASQDEPYEKMWINLDGELVRKIFSFFNLSTLYVAEVNVMNIFIEIHDKLEHIDDTNESETYAEIMSLLFNMLVAATRERFFPSTSNNTSVDEKIRAYIDKNIYNDITLDDIASEFGITKMHVIRLFKQRYNNNSDTVHSRQEDINLKKPAHRYAHADKRDSVAAELLKHAALLRSFQKSSRMHAEQVQTGKIKISAMG